MFLEPLIFKTTRMRPGEKCRSAPGRGTETEQLRCPLFDFNASFVYTLSGCSSLKAIASCIMIRSPGMPLPSVKASLSEPLRSKFCECGMELRDKIERMLPMRLSIDFPRKRGRSVGRQAAMTATPASTWDQTTTFVTIAVGFVRSVLTKAPNGPPRTT